MEYRVLGNTGIEVGEIGMGCEGMTEEKTIIISTHQVHDVERLLDHVTIIDRNCVLLQQPLVEETEPINLEELFIKTTDIRSRTASL